MLISYAEFQKNLQWSAESGIIGGNHQHNSGTDRDGDALTMGINPILALQAALGVLTAIFVAGWTAAVLKVRRSARRRAFARPRTRVLRL